MSAVRVSLVLRWWVAPLLPHKAIPPKSSALAALAWSALWSLLAVLAIRWFTFEPHPKEPGLSRVYDSLMHMQALLARTVLTAIWIWLMVKLFAKKNTGFTAAWAMVSLLSLPLLLQWLAPATSDVRWIWFAISELWHAAVLALMIRFTCGVKILPVALISFGQIGLVLLTFERIWGFGFFW